MTAQSTTSEAPLRRRRWSAATFLGFGNALKKEMTEWLRGTKTLIVAGVAIAVSVFATLVPLIEEATSEPGEVLGRLTDPTAAVLLGWGSDVSALIVIVATIGLLTTERDRGTLAWNLANPVSPTSIIAAKFIAAFAVLSVAVVLLPLVVSIGVATFAFGGVPDLRELSVFGLVFLMLPALYVGLTVALGAAARSTAAVAGIALAVMFVPELLGSIFPGIAEVSPTSIGRWAEAVAVGDPASMLIPATWLLSMVLFTIGAKVVFDRQEF